MISMMQKQEILIRYIRDGESVRKIARELAINRRTVKRYVENYEAKRQELIAGCRVEEVFVEELVRAPQYNSANRGRRRLTEDITRQLDEFMAANQEKRSRGLGKQLMKKVDMWEALREGGHCIGYTSVCNYVRSRTSGNREVYIKQQYEAGVSCEFDWAEVRLVIGGKEERLMLAVFTSAMSNYRYARLMWRQDMPSFQQAHVDFFTHLGGAYAEMVYDNMRVAIRQFTVKGKEPTQGLLELASYYQFRWRFCNEARGNEKGHVERSVEYVRRKSFCRHDEFDSLEAANLHVEEVLERLNALPLQGKEESAGMLLDLERPHLFPSPPPFDCAKIEEVRVDKYSTICSGTNHYSVPEQWAGKVVQLRIYPAQLVVYAEGRQLCRHERRKGQHNWYLQLEHYVDTLRSKPGALAGSVALAAAGEYLRRFYERYCTQQPRLFIDLLHYQRQKQLSWQQIEAAVERLPHTRPEGISLDMVKILCEQPAAPALSQQPTDCAIEQASLQQLALLAQLMNQPPSSIL
jgi:transposase-like protein